MSDFIKFNGCFSPLPDRQPSQLSLAGIDPMQNQRVNDPLFLRDVDQFSKDLSS